VWLLMCRALTQRSCLVELQCSALPR
jgi:hypothetical protein